MIWGDVLVSDGLGRLVPAFQEAITFLLESSIRRINWKYPLAKLNYGVTPANEGF